MQAASCITCDSEHCTSSPSPHSRLFWGTAFCSSLNDPAHTRHRGSLTQSSGGMSQGRVMARVAQGGTDLGTREATPKQAFMEGKAATLAAWGTFVTLLPALACSRAGKGGPSPHHLQPESQSGQDASPRLCRATGPSFLQKRMTSKVCAAAVTLGRVTKCLG